MTREQSRLVDSLWSALRDHRKRHGCAQVEIPGADLLRRYMGPPCADALLGFVADLDVRLGRGPVHCGVCGQAMAGNDRIPFGQRLAHFACAGSEQLARTGARKVSVAAGRSSGMAPR